MKKTLIRVLCVLLCVALCPIILTSCKGKTIFSLGPYEITKGEYNYLAGMYVRQVLESLGLYGYSFDAVVESSGLSIGESLDMNYTDSFQANVFSLLYSQLLFDIYELELSDETEKLIDQNIQTILNYYGKGSEQGFNKYSKEYGYDADDMRSVYTMQMKQSMLVDHLYGASGEKISTEELDKLYTSNYMHFQTIVINTSYKLVWKDTDGDGVNDTSDLLPLSEETIQQRKDIIDDLTNLLVSPVEGYTYKVIDPSLSYDELYSLYSDDTAYPQGCYSKYPTSISGQNAITAAALLNINDVGKIIAKRLFTQSGSIQIGDETINVNAGDYFSYGYVFVKRLPLGQKPYENPIYNDFFSNFRIESKNVLFMEYLQRYEATEANYTLECHIDDLSTEMPLSKAVPNNLDYNFFYGNLGKSSN